ncbi:MAG: methionyl-tRNA formyltransferase [Planctomycetaceae bacterium]|jgi:methionyl-tRNA formyltransferase|nr:methionyl-tRNA formyltransferase [Planctomycetaceae bacterium]
MKIMVMGTGEFAVPTFKKLIAANPRHEVQGLVSIASHEPMSTESHAPEDRKSVRHEGGRHRSREMSPMEKIAIEKKIDIFYTDNVNSFKFYRFIYLAETELLFVCDFGKILSDQILSSAKLGGINLHGSLLPKYRGAAPVHWAILNGEQYTGVSIIRMTSQLDGGPIIASSGPVAIGAKETVLEVERNLSQIGADMVLKTIDKMESGEHLQIIGQQAGGVTYAPKIKKQDGLINWSVSSEEILNHYRAMYPWPASYTFWHSADGKTLRLKVGPFSRVAHPQVTGGSPGTVLVADGDVLIVATKDGCVRIERVHPDGRKMMDASSFMRGYNIKVGDVLGELRTQEEWGV